MKKKTFLFFLSSIFLAGFWFGGISLAAGDINCNETTAIAKIGDECYTSLASAIDDAAESATIDLLKNDDVSFSDSNLEIEINKSITINWNGKSIQWVSDANANSSNWHDIYIYWNGDVTIENLTITNFGYEKWTNRYISPIYTFKLFKVNIA